MGPGAEVFDSLFDVGGDRYAQRPQGVRHRRPEAPVRLSFGLGEFPSGGPRRPGGDPAVATLSKTILIKAILF